MTQLNPEAPEPGAHSRRTWVMIAVVIALTALAISMVPEDEPVVVNLPPLPAAEDIAPQKTPAPQTDAGETVAKAQETSATAAETAGTKATPATPSTDAATDKSTPGQAARAFIAQLHQQGKEDPDGAVAEAEKHTKAKQPEDAYLLYFYAARLGHAEAALALASQADPAYHGDDSSALSRPDIPLALKWYSQADAAGSKTAKSRLTALRSRVEQAATQGDQEAQRLVLQWK